MRPVSPVIPGENMNEVNVAEHQPEYQTLPTLQFEGGNILSRWVMDDNEKEIVEVTGELYICLLTFGFEPPETLFQVDCPIIGDSPDVNLKAKTAYPGTSLPVLYADEKRIWLHLKLTEADRATLARDGNVYFFMNTKGNSVTPSMIQVENPGFRVEVIVGARATENIKALAARHNIETASYTCAECGHETYVSKQLSPRIDADGMRVICTICSKANGDKYCFLSETASELKRVIQDNRNSQN